MYHEYLDIAWLSDMDIGVLLSIQECVYLHINHNISICLHNIATYRNEIYLA